MQGENYWHNSVPDREQFLRERDEILSVLAQAGDLRQTALGLLREANSMGFSHKNTWLGVPIIRLPEDMLLQQELIWSEKPDVIIEIGVARGGGLIFNASMQHLSGLIPNVIGIDNKIYPHTHEAISKCSFSNHIKVLEGHSTSLGIRAALETLLVGANKVLLILDSDHSASHVLDELRAYVPLLPKSSLVIVCDTIIDEQPPNTYPNRTWSDGRGPSHAISEFMRQSEELDFYFVNENRSLVLSEIRNGILVKV